IRAIDAQVSTLEEPIQHRMEVIPTWVSAQLQNAAELVGEVPERARAEFQRLGINFTIHPVHTEGTPFLRAVGSGNFEQLAFRENTPFPTTGRLSQRTAP